MGHLKILIKIKLINGNNKKLMITKTIINKKSLKIKS